MKVVIGKKLGHVTKPGVRPYRESPGSINAALHAAAHYAKKNNTNMVLVASDNFGSIIWQILKETDDVRRVAPGIGDREVDGYLANPECDVFEAKIRK
jgi:hypothetical protein